MSRGRSAEPGALIFVHIPKTAGMTLRSILARQFPPEAVHTIRGQDPEAYGEAIRAFAALPEEERRRIRLLQGHVAFGLHRLLPQGAAYVTMLRDPVARAASHYRYVLSNPGHELHELVTSRGMSLADYVQAGLRKGLNDGQVRLLSGDGSSEFGQVSRELLERAKRNIEERFPVVGLSERFDESLLLMKRRFGWRRVFYVSRNVARGTASQPALDPEAVATIERHNRLDRELYRFAEERLDEQLRHASALAAELAWLRFLNRAYAARRRRQPGRRRVEPTVLA
jgi:hypothetical protein